MKFMTQFSGSGEKQLHRATALQIEAPQSQNSGRTKNIAKKMHTRIKGGSRELEPLTY